MMKTITIELTDEAHEDLRELSDIQQITPEQLAAKILTQVLEPYKE